MYKEKYKIYIFISENKHASQVKRRTKKEKEE